MLRTRVTDLFSIKYPIMSAPMSGHSSAELAAAGGDRKAARIRLPFLQSLFAAC